MSVFRKTSFIGLFLIGALVTFVGRSALNGDGRNEDPEQSLYHPPKRVYRVTPTTPYDRSEKGPKKSLKKGSKEKLLNLRPQSVAPLEYDAEGRPFIPGEKELDPRTLMKIVPAQHSNAMVFQLPVFVPPAK
jgi:hypothetical protein